MVRLQNQHQIFGEAGSGGKDTDIYKM